MSFLSWAIALVAVLLLGHHFGPVPFGVGVVVLILAGWARFTPPAAPVFIGTTAAVLFVSPVASIAAAPAAPVPVLPAVPSGPGVVYTQAQMEQGLVAAGIPEPAAHTGGAIGMSESHGRSDALRICPPTCIPGQAPEHSIGPWQINVLAHPSVSAACAMALACVAPVVRAISGGGRDWRAWGSYTNGTWRQFA